MYANGGDCLDCDAGNSVDRIAFLTPLFGHVFAFAFDYSATLALDPKLKRFLHRIFGAPNPAGVNGVPHEVGPTGLPAPGVER